MSTQERSEAIDIIVTIATGYKDVAQFRQFISTLRRTGASCPIFIGIHEANISF